MARQPIRNPALRPLAALIGRWPFELTFASAPATVRHGEATFEWLDDGAFLVTRSICKDAIPPSTAVIGRDGPDGAWFYLYCDERGVSRVFAMRFEADVWMLERHGEPFPQRFHGVLSADGRMLDGRWERQDDNARWMLDLRIVYRRAV